MDKAVDKYKKRRQGRLDDRFGKKVDSVAEFKKRRAERLDGNVGWAYGLAKSKGIDTTGMSPKEVFEALKGEGGDEKSSKKKTSGNNVKPDKNSGEVGTTYTKEYKTSAGVSYPKLKSGAVYDEDTLKEVNRLADDTDGNIPPKTEALGKTLKKLTSEDITYQKDPDGTIVASIPGLSQMYDREVKGKSPEVQKMYDERVEGGKKITSDMIAISDRLGSRMMGLENCFKGGGSTSRKIDKVKAKEKAKTGLDLTDEQALAKMDDVVRYSYKCDHDKMVDQILGLEKELKKSGYEITERDNKFLPSEDGEPRNYKAVHLQVKAPSGELFEVQIQSEDTIKIKNKNHETFEKWRKLDPKKHPEQKKEADRLNAIMVKNYAGLKEPMGIMDLKTIKKPKKVNENK